jgi:hypothetical protein
MTVRRIVTVALVTSLLVGVGAASVNARRTTRRAPARMLVYAQEWSLWPSRPSLPSGKVTVQLWNRGEDAHDLRIRRLNRSGRMVGRTQGVAVTQSGGLRQANWTLAPGTYMLYCSMPGHYARGMHTRIIVR